MAEDKDELIRFLLPEAKARGVVIRGKHIAQEAFETHGLEGEPSELFTQALLSSILLLSTSKGGVRQVVQLDAKAPDAPIQRMQAEVKNGTVRGYVLWHEDAVVPSDSKGVEAWLGKGFLFSTVRDLGFGHPYISTIQYESEWLADHVMHFLKQSVQVQADLVLHGNLAMMIEAMPGSDEKSWFSAVEAMAKISQKTLEKESIESILSGFADLGCKIVGRDSYSYSCSCSDENMLQVLEGLAHEDLYDLADENGDVILSCQYCKRTTKVNKDKDFTA